MWKKIHNIINIAIKNQVNKNKRLQKPNVEEISKASTSK